MKKNTEEPCSQRQAQSLRWLLTTDSSLRHAASRRAVSSRLHASPSSSESLKPDTSREQFVCISKSVYSKVAAESSQATHHAIDVVCEAQVLVQLQRRKCQVGAVLRRARSQSSRRMSCS